MSRQTESLIKSAAVGAAAGGLTFWAVRSLTGNSRLRRKTTAKAAKIIGSLMDML